MNNLVTKLSSIAALLGVLGAIGAGFVQYGKLTAKITELDKRKAVINQSVDLDPLHEKISALEVDLIDRIKAGDKEVEAKIKPQDLSSLIKSIQEVREQVASLNIPKETDLKPLNEAIKELENKISKLDTDVKIVQKENQLQDILIEEIKTKANNPLAN
jgi:polyhydroxyalkanoate synthesis regulator phasin